MDRAIAELMAKVVSAALAHSAREESRMIFSFPADEALVLVQSSLERVASGRADNADPLMLTAALQVLSELPFDAPEQALLLRVVAILRASGIDLSKMN